MRNTKMILTLMGAILLMTGIQSCGVINGAPYAEIKIAQDVYEAACGVKEFDPCRPNAKWNVCAPGESGMCQPPTCTGGHITHLSLWCNQLITVPPEIGQLAYLEELNLYGNPITGLPAKIGQLSHLKILSLHGNQLTSLPIEIGQLASLEKLNLYENLLTDLPAEIGQLSHLKILNLYGNQLTSLPPEIGQLASLEELNLYSNMLTGLPAEIGQLSHLKILNLHGNQLTSLPPEIGQLANLEELDLSKNRLTSLLPEIGQLANLENLDVSDNQLSVLPTEIGQLIHLTQLIVDRNPLNGTMPTFLTNLPLDHFGYTITGLCIPDDKAFHGWPFNGYMCADVTQIPDAERAALTSLYEQVGLDESWHPGIPPCRWVGVNCWNGHVRNIQLTNRVDHELSQLPVEVTQLSQLESLSLDGNRLETLPPEFEQLENLTRLTLNNNLFSSIPSQIGHLHQLEYLDVSGNSLSGLVPDFLIELPLKFFYYQDTTLCIPNNEKTRIWLGKLVEHSDSTACLP